MSVLLDRYGVKWADFICGSVVSWKTVVNCWDSDVFIGMSYSELADFQKLWCH